MLYNLSSWDQTFPVQYLTAKIQGTSFTVGTWINKTLHLHKRVGCNTNPCPNFSGNLAIETVSPEGTFCDTVQVPSRGGDMELI